MLRLPPVYAMTDRSRAACADPAELARAPPSRRDPRGAAAREGAARPGSARGRRTDRVAGPRGRGRLLRQRPRGRGAARPGPASISARTISRPRTLVPCSVPRPSSASRRTIPRRRRRAFGDPAPPTTSRSGPSSRARRRRRAPRGASRISPARPRSRNRPLVAIGGISLDRLDAVWDAGADSAAMIGGLYAGGRIEENARAALDRSPAAPCSRGGSTSSASWPRGKTTIGRRVAETARRSPFVDLDDEIERHERPDDPRDLRGIGRGRLPASGSRRSSRRPSRCRRPSWRPAAGASRRRRTAARIGRRGMAVFLDVGARDRSSAPPGQDRPAALRQRRAARRALRPSRSPSIEWRP